MLLRDALGFVDREGGHAIRTEVADVDDSFHTRVCRGFGQVLRALNVGGEQVAPIPLSLGAGEVDDMVHAREGGAQSARVAQAGNRYFERDAGWKSGCARRGADERTQGMSRLEHVSEQGASDKSRPTGD